jgi:hypothetical protein
LLKTFTQKINKPIPSPVLFNIKISVQLMQNLRETPIRATYSFASPDISNMYSNIPITETKQILYNSLKNALINPDTNKNTLIGMMSSRI